MTQKGYVGQRRQGTLEVVRTPDGTRLTPNRSLELVNHSPSGFEVGYRGSGPAQLACALLLDYYEDEQIALDHYTQFKNEVVSQLKCTGPNGRWRLTGPEIEAVVGAERSELIAL